MNDTRRIVVSSVRHLLPPNRPSSEALERHFSHLEDLLRVAGKRGTDIAILSERCTGQIPETAEPFPGGMQHARFAAMAASLGIYLIAPVLEKEAGRVYATALIYDRTGALAGKYRKTHLTPGEKAGGLTAGNSLDVFDLGIANIGLLICYDAIFSEAARTLALKGADIIFLATHQFGPGRWYYDTQIRGMAATNICFVVTASNAKPDGDAWGPYAAAHNCYNPSWIVNRDGSILADCGEHPGVATAEFDLDRRFFVKGMGHTGIQDFWRVVCTDRRPELYQVLTQPGICPVIPLSTKAGHGSC